MATQNPLKELLGKIRLPQAEWISLRSVNETTTYRAARDGRPESNTAETSAGLMIEVLVQGSGGCQVGYAALPLSGLTAQVLQLAAERAYQQAQAAATYGVYPFRPEHRKSEAQGYYSSPVLRPLNSRTPGELNDLLIRITQKLKVSPKIVRTTAALRSVLNQTHYISTSGTEWSQDFTYVSTSFEATAQEGSLVQQRSDQGGFARSFQSGLEALESPDLWDRIRIIGEQSVELLSAQECPTETTSLILMPDQMILQIHESIGHPLELDRIIGDERNYAGWSFVRPEDFGKLRYGSSVMNVTFDPTVPGEFASYAFDDSGMKAERAHLIEKGILKRGLGSRESQLRSNIPGVANARACSWNRPPIDRMANLNLEPGTSSLSEMISSVERGVLMEANRSWSIDDFRNKFQFGCEYAKLIENGKITSTLRNPNYRGHTVPFWNNLKAVGNRETMQCLGTPYCGKGEPNQMIRVGHASPACLFEQIEVFGGGQ
jgi:predicted Zn-dependent protease